MPPREVQGAQLRQPDAREALRRGGAECAPDGLRGRRQERLGQDREPLSITIRRDGSIFLQKEKVSEDVLVDKLKAIAANGYDQRIFVRGDDRAIYGKVMEVMGLLAAAGFTHIGLVTDVVKPKPNP